MCRCIGKILGKLLMTISVVVIFGLCAWISFDVYNTAVDFTDSKYMTASPYNATNGI